MKRSDKSEHHKKLELQLLPFHWEWDDMMEHNDVVYCTINSPGHPGFHSGYPWCGGPHFSEEIRYAMD